jgi:hypothetical protein
MYAPYEPYAPNAPAMPFGAVLPGADPRTWSPMTVSSGAAALRAQPCYSQELSDCINTTAPSSVANCEVIRAAYKLDAKAMDAAAEGLKFCPASSAPSLGAMIAVGAFGVAAGLLLGALLR